MTFSAPSFSTKSISAITVGWELARRQLSISPPIGAMTASMSAAVVPGAKLLAITVYGLAIPRMLIPLAPFVALLRMLTWPFAVFGWSARSSEYRRFPRGSIREAEFVRGSWDTRVARGLLRECRSCPHLLLILGLGLAEGRYIIQEVVSLGHWTAP